MAAMELRPRRVRPNHIFVGLIVIVSHFVVAYSTQTDGEGGEVCGERRCLAGKAYCDTNTTLCVCKDRYTFGRGDINCYEKNTFHTELFNDPTVNTYNGNKIPLYAPCRFLWTHTYTYLKGRKRKREGYCEFKAHAFHQKDGGKIYIGGFDVAIRLEYDNGTVRNMSIRKWGKAANGNYQHWLAATDHEYLPDGPWGNDSIKYYDPRTKLRIQCRYDEINNLAVLKVKKCGIDIQFRPYDCVLRKKQTMIPHLSYSVNCAYHPTFRSPHKVVAIPPDSHGGRVTIDDILIPGLDREGTILYRALITGTPQNGPWANEECALAKPTLEKCSETELVTAFQKCLFLFKVPRFIKCFDKTTSGIGLMRLFNGCVSVFCDGASCNDLIQIIKDSKCHQIKKPYSKVTDFVSGSECP